MVVMNIADHMTRSKYRVAGGKPRVIGAILGQQEDRVLEVCNTVEIEFTAKQDLTGASQITINEKFFNERLDAYKTMFPDLDCLGWYSADATAGADPKFDEPTKGDLEILKKVISKRADNPLMLIMNEESGFAKDRKKIPFFLYELAVKTDNVEAPKPFVQLDFTLASEASEQIAVDGVANAVDPDSKTSNFTSTMQASLNAVKILRSKLNFLIKVVKESPEVRSNQNFMRRL